MMCVDDKEAQSNSAKVKKRHRIFQRNLMHFTIEKERGKKIVDTHTQV